MTTMTTDLDHVADLAMGIEQQLIELVNRRASVVLGTPAATRLDNEILDLQESLGDLSERLSLP